MFVKDPETGKRTPVARPKDDWVVEDRPALAIVDDVLWNRVQERLNLLRVAYGAKGTQSLNRLLATDPRTGTPRDPEAR